MLPRPLQMLSSLVPHRHLACRFEADERAREQCAMANFETYQATTQKTCRELQHHSSMFVCNMTRTFQAPSHALQVCSCLLYFPLPTSLVWQTTDISAEAQDQICVSPHLSGQRVGSWDPGSAQCTQCTTNEHFAVKSMEKWQLMEIWQRQQMHVHWSDSEFVKPKNIRTYYSVCVYVCACPLKTKLSDAMKRGIFFMSISWPYIH